MGMKARTEAHTPNNHLHGPPRGRSTTMESRMSTEVLLRRLYVMSFHAQRAIDELKDRPGVDLNTISQAIKDGLDAGARRVF